MPVLPTVIRLTEISCALFNREKNNWNYWIVVACSGSLFQIFQQHTNFNQWLAFSFNDSRTDFRITATPGTHTHMISAFLYFFYYLPTKINTDKKPTTPISNFTYTHAKFLRVQVLFVHSESRAPFVVQFELSFL